MPARRTHAHCLSSGRLLVIADGLEQAIERPADVGGDLVRYGVRLAEELAQAAGHVLPPFGVRRAALGFNAREDHVLAGPRERGRRRRAVDDALPDLGHGVARGLVARL